MILRAYPFLVVLLSTVGAHACSIPVFRYALDRWEADPYVLDVSASDARDEAVARFLRNFTDSTPLNLRPVRSKEDGPSRLLFPHTAPGAPPAWSGALDGATLATLTGSPARTEIVRHILEGDSGVWILVESGNSALDDQAAKSLQKRLRFLEQVAQVPPIDPSDPTSKLGPGPALGVKFPVLRLKRDDPAEQPFLNMLAGPRAGREVASGPWLAVVFGRGRVLGAWPAEGFGDEQIEEACLFLLGACSCEVKRMNPGWDLLLAVDWDKDLQAAATRSAEIAAVPPHAEAPASPSAAPETVTFTASDSGAEVAARAPTDRRYTLGFVGAGALALVAGWLVWRSTHKNA